MTAACDDAGDYASATEGAPADVRGDVSIIPTGDREPLSRGRRAPPGNGYSLPGAHARDEEGDNQVTTAVNSADDALLKERPPNQLIPAMLMFNASQRLEPPTYQVARHSHYHANWPHAMVMVIS